MTFPGGRTAWSVVRSTGSTPTTNSLGSVPPDIHEPEDGELAIQAGFTADGFAPWGPARTRG